MGLYEKIKNFRWGYLLLSFVLCAIGICFVVYPTQSMTTTSYIIGAVALIASVVQLVNILANRKRGFGFAVAIIVDASTFICAAIAFMFPNATIQFYPVIIGLMIIMDGSFKLQTVINAKKYNLKMWWFLLIFACMAILGGFFLIRMHYSEENMILYLIVLGASIFICGLQNLFSLFYFGKISSRAAIHIDSANSSNAELDAVAADSFSKS